MWLCMGFDTYNYTTWKLFWNCPDACLILQYLHMKCNLLIFQYNLVARPTYESAAYRLYSYTQWLITNLHDAIQFSSSSKLSTSHQCALSVIYITILSCNGRLYQLYLEVRCLFPCFCTWFMAPNYPLVWGSLGFTLITTKPCMVSIHLKCYKLLITSHFPNAMGYYFKIYKSSTW